MPFTIDPDRHPSARSGETHRITHGRASIMDSGSFRGVQNRGSGPPSWGPPGERKIGPKKSPPPDFGDFF